VRLGLIKFVIVGEAAIWSMWENWMLDHFRRQSGQLVFFQGEGHTAKTVVFYDACCVYYQCRFDARGQNGQASFEIEIHLSAAAIAVDGKFTEAHSLIPWVTDAATRRRALSMPMSQAPTVGLLSTPSQPVPNSLSVDKDLEQAVTAVVAEEKHIGLQESEAEIRSKYGEAGVTLVKQIEARALEILATQSNSERGPVLSGVMDAKTGVIYHGQNTNSAPADLHPLLKDRLDHYDKVTVGQAPINLGVPGAHSEIHALNQAIKARERITGVPVTEKDLSDFLLHNRSLRGKTKGIGVPPRCTNCVVLTYGITVIGNN
jgi:hypothetical protein